MKKYAVYPGYVGSKNDEQRHYIYAHKLMELYGVHSNECIIVDRKHPEKYLGADISKLKKLFPDFTGKYDL